MMHEPTLERLERWCSQCCVLIFLAAVPSCDALLPTAPPRAVQGRSIPRAPLAGAAAQPRLTAGTGEAPDKRAEPPEEELRLTLEEAVRTAVENNFVIKVADLDRDIGWRNWIIEKAVFDPFVSASGDYAKSRSPTSSFLDVGVGGLQPVVTANPFETNSYAGSVGGRTLWGTEYSLSLGQSWFDRPLAEGSLYGINPQSQLNATVQIRQPLLKSAWYRYNSARIRIAANNRLSAERQLELTATELVFETESAYWQLSYALRNHETQEKLLRTAEENLQKAREERSAGRGAEVDVIVAESQLALRRVELQAARTARYNARDQLLLLLNRSGTRSLKRRWESGLRGAHFDRITVTPISEPMSSPFSADRDESIRLAFENRPDYEQLQIEIENKGIQVDTAKNDALPDLGLTASWTQHGLDEDVEGALDSLGSGQFYSWAVGMELRIPLSNRGPRNNYLRTKDELLQLKYRQAQLENEIVTSIDQSLRNLRTLYEGIQDLDERARLQQELLAKELEKLELGRSTYYNVSVIENDVVESQAQSLRAKADYQTAVADYLRLTGLLLRSRGIEIAPP